MAARLLLGDDSWLKITTLCFHHGLKTALESSVYIPLCVPWKIFEWLLDLGHQLILGVAGKVIGDFFSTATMGLDSRGLGEQKLVMMQKFSTTSDSFWKYGQELNTDTTHMAFQQQFSPAKLWPQSSAASRWIEALFKDVGWHDVTLFRNTSKESHSLRELAFPDAWDTSWIVGKPPVVPVVVATGPDWSSFHLRRTRSSLG